MRGLSIHSVMPAILLSLGLAGCSKTVQWEEEVLLNVGQTITIKRKTELHYDISQDRLFNPYWQFKADQFDFEWRGVSYSYRSEPDDASLATVSPLVLAIDSADKPTFLGYADSYWVHHKAQGCGAAPIVRLVAQGHRWQSAPSDDPWILGLQINLRSGTQPPEAGTKFTWSEKIREFDSWTPQARSLNQKFQVDSCKKGVSQ